MQPVYTTKCTVDEHTKAVSSTAESVNDKHMKRNDVVVLNLPFQNMANVKLLPMIPTRKIIPMTRVSVMNM